MAQPWLVGSALLSAVPFALLLGCSDSSHRSREDSPGSALPPNEEPAEGSPSDDVFDPTRIATYELTLDPARWAALQANARDETYAEADLRVGDEHFERVGLRFKGGYGSLVLCFDESGQQICPKLSMKIKLDEYLPEQRYRGLKRLNFNSMSSDASLLHERLGYELFRGMGVVAPRSAHARLSVNGEVRGVFSLVEEVDGRFTHQHFEGGDGNVYKEQWPVTSDARALDASLRTNEDAPDHTALMAFSAELAAASPDELPAVVASYMDVDQLMSYLAVDRAISNWDGITAFYCSESGCYNHNYFLYQDESEPRFTLIPWDLDNTFALVGPLASVPGALDIPDDCSTRLPGIGPLLVAAPACDPLLGGLARSERSRYVARASELLEGPLDAARLDVWLHQQQALLEPFVLEDVYGPGLEAFRSAVEKLRADLRLAGIRVAAERDGERIERFTLGALGMNDFESSNPLGLELGIAAHSAPESSFRVTLGMAGALAGERDLRLAFDFRDGLVPWAQWARLSLPFDAPRVDLTTLSVLRLSLRSDRRRTLRISFDSSRYTQPESGATFGWDVVVDASAQTLELPLSSATYPVWGPSVPETREVALAETTALLFDPIAEGRNDEGFLGPSVTDSGQIQIDQISFE